MPCRKFLLPWILVAAFAGCAAAADEFTPEIENNWVRVLRIRETPSGHIAPREWPPSVVVYLTGAHERIITADGQSREVTHKAGETAYIEGSRRGLENVSDRPMEAVVIELKPARIHSAPVKLDPVQLDPKYHLVDFE